MAKTKKPVPKLTDIINVADLRKAAALEAKNQFINEVTRDLSKSFVDGALTGGNPLLKSSQVKQILNCSESTLERLRKSGELPCIKMRGSYLYQKSEVENLLNN